MACDSELEFTVVDFTAEAFTLNSFGPLNAAILAYKETHTCGETVAAAQATLDAIIPSDTNAYLETGSIANLATVTFANGAPGLDRFTGANLIIDSVLYGNWVIHYGTDGTNLGVTDFTTYGPTAIMGDVNTIEIQGAESAVSIAGVTRLTGGFAENWVACLAPECAIIPPFPPFPPFLPPTVNWPNITPAPTPPTAAFPPGQPPNQVLGIGANYSIFSNFGFKG